MRGWVVGCVAALAAGAAQAQLVIGYPRCPHWENGSLMIVQVDGMTPNNPGQCADIVVSGTVVQAVRGWMPRNKRLSFPMQTYCNPPTTLSDSAPSGQDPPENGEWIVVWWPKGSPEKDGSVSTISSYARIKMACDLGLRPEDVIHHAR